MKTFTLISSHSFLAESAVVGSMLATSARYSQRDEMIRYVSEHERSECSFKRWTVESRIQCSEVNAEYARYSLLSLYDSACFIGYSPQDNHFGHPVYVLVVNLMAPDF